MIETRRLTYQYFLKATIMSRLLVYLRCWCPWQLYLRKKNWSSARDICMYCSVVTVAISVANPVTALYSNATEHQLTCQVAEDPGHDSGGWTFRYHPPALWFPLSGTALSAWRDTYTADNLHCTDVQKVPHTHSKIIYTPKATISFYYPGQGGYVFPRVN